MTTIKKVEVPGLESPTISELLASDSRPVNPILLEDGNDYLGDNEQVVDTDRFYSREFQKLEDERMWSRVWQVACREEQIPNVGDYVLYEIAGKSLIIVRSKADEIRAYFNACLHRGRTLCERDGNARNFRCKFHGWMYSSVDGKLAPVPSAWDFGHIKREDYRLPQAKVGRWGGFVFINLDSNSISLEDYIKDIPEQFALWNMEDRFLAAHVGQVIRANWKVAVEAFLENYHVMATHTQVLSYVGDANAQYSVHKDRPHYSRLVFALGIPSPHVAAHTTEDQIISGLDSAPGRRESLNIPRPLPPGKTLRQCAGDSVRASLAAMTGDEGFAQVSDTEVLDGWVYTLFPNFTLWGGYGNLCYRFRPWNNDPEMSLMEIMVLPPAPKNGPRPPAVKMTLLGPDQNFEDAPELGSAGPFFNQDLFNMAWMQKGMRSLMTHRVTLANYQESQIRHFHRTLDMYVYGDELPR